MSIAKWLEEQSPIEEIQPATSVQLQAEKEARQSNLIQIEFWSGEYTFQNCNEARVTGRIKDQAHMTALLRRAMERARDEGRSIRITNGMNTARLERVTDADIETHCQER